MEFKIQRSEFLKGLRIAQSIADRKSTMPMLANVLLRVSSKDKVLLAATDLNVSIAAELSSTNSGEGGITVGAKALHDIVANLPGDEVSLTRGDNNWAEIRSGKVVYRLVGMPDRDFPRLPEHREVEFTEVDASGFRDMIEHTMFAVCNDETRFHLNGVLMECDGKRALMVSTDGHRLAKIERDFASGPKLTSGVIIPKKGVAEIRRILDATTSCKVAFKTPYIFVSTSELTLAVKLIEADFPPYGAVIPKDHPKQAVIERVLLLDALKRSQLMSSENRGVKFQLAKGTLLLTSDNPDMGEVREEVDADYDGDDLTIGFNGRYVIEFLNHIDSDQITLELGGELDPGLIRPVANRDYLGVIMPMRI